MKQIIKYKIVAMRRNPSILNPKSSILLVFFTILSLFYLIDHIANNPGKAMVVSISSDGHYAVSSHLNRFIVLWNLKTRHKKIISHYGNIYSAYFIKQTHFFMWQDLFGTVHIQSIDGKEIKTFSNFQTYGHVMTSHMEHYFSVDANGNVFEKTNSKQDLIQRGKYNFKSIGQLKKLMLSNNNHYLLMTDYASSINASTLWDIQKKCLWKTFSGNVGKVIGAISPDDKTIVIGDENSNVLLWNGPSGSFKFRLWSIWNGKRLSQNLITGFYEYDASQKFIHPPHNRFFSRQNKQSHVFALKFIAPDYYLRFITGIPYAILYRIDDPKPLKYLDLGNWPFPSVNDYSRNLAIDTAPFGHLLVMGMANQGGIMVYHFDVHTKVLRKLADVF